MEYPAKTISLNKVQVGPNGVQKSLCEHCKSRDCTNPIENREVALYGISTNMKLWVRGSNVAIVSQCEGFIS